jgi:F420-0:gamma-glutamyl ligase
MEHSGAAPAAVRSWQAIVVLHCNAEKTISAIIISDAKTRAFRSGYLRR